MMMMRMIMMMMIVVVVVVVVGTVRATVCGTTVPSTVIRTSDNVAYVQFRSSSPRDDIRFQLNFSSSVEGPAFCSVL